MPWPGALPRMCIRGNAPVVSQKHPVDVEKCTPFFKIAFQAIGDLKKPLSQDGYHLTTQYILVNG
jgi:hypothetical protein